MANFTKKAILDAFTGMLAQMPLDRITVSALVRRCQISPNTFYYHFQNIDQLLEQWLQQALVRFDLNGDPSGDWRPKAKAILKSCRQHSAIIYHISDGLSRDHLERYVFSLTDDFFSRRVCCRAEPYLVPEAVLRELADFCRYAFMGFFLKFLWNRMEGDIDGDVDRVGELLLSFLDHALSAYPRRPG